MKKIYVLIFIVVVFGIVILGVGFGYNFYVIKDISNNDLEQKDYVTANFLNVNANKTEETQVNNVKVAKITPSTKMVYEYFYKDDKITEKVEDVPPYFLIDLTREDIERDFKNWQVKSFSEREVVLQKVIEGESVQHYIIGEYDGFVAVFYEREINGTRLKDITDIPISSLSQEEQNKIKEGIKIVGKDELIKFLQNYDA